MLLYVVLAVWLLVWAGLSTCVLIWADKRQLDLPSVGDLLFIEGMLGLWPLWLASGVVVLTLSLIGLGILGLLALGVVTVEVVVKGKPRTYFN